MTQTPEERRDSAIADIIAAGGMVLGCDPLATTSEPHMIAAYRIRAGASDADILAALQTVQTATELDQTGLIDCSPEEVPDESTSE